MITQKRMRQVYKQISKAFGMELALSYRKWIRRQRDAGLRTPIENCSPKLAQILKGHNHDL